MTKYFALVSATTILPLPGCLSFQQALDKVNQLCPDGHDYILEEYEVRELKASIETLGLKDVDNYRPAFSKEKE